MGNKRNKSERLKQRVKLVVLGEGLTEYYYFKHLKNFLNYKISMSKKDFQPSSNLEFMQKKAQSYLDNNHTVICVFDMDITSDTKIKSKIDNFIRVHKNSSRIAICRSMPTIEFWFLLHFVYTDRYFETKKAVVEELRKIPGFEEYQTTGKYLEKEHWIKLLIEKLDLAIDNANMILSNKTNNKSNSYTYLPKAIKMMKEFDK